MNARRAALVAALAVVAVAAGWLLFVGLPRWYGGPSEPQVAAAAATEPPAAEADGRKIKARLFYVADDGTRLTSVEREVPYADQTITQARRIIEAQLAPVQPPLVSAIPAGTTLRAVFVTESGSAFVDLSREVAMAHPGGSGSELLTIYTVVQVLTTNLPAITSVQILVDGKEVDTLAGHVDIKRPLPRADEWVVENVSR
jgi:spore germination protein GerM